jgi:hypothetical protein
MRPDRQRLLNKLATLGAFLCRVARSHSDHLTANTRSLATQDPQKRAPRGVQNALCQSTSRQTANVEVFDNDRLVRIRVPFRGLEMKVPALALDFQLLQLDAVPLIATLEARKASLLISMSKERFHRFLEPIGKALDGRGRNVGAALTFEQCSQVVLAQELAGFLIVRALVPQHFVVQLARPGKARIQTAALLSVRVQARMQHLFWTEAAKADEALLFRSSAISEGSS